MEDYIFILIAILLSVFGAINRKKKQREQTAGDEETHADGRPSVFDELFEDPLFAEEKPRVIRPAETRRYSPADAYQAISNQTAAVKIPTQVRSDGKTPPPPGKTPLAAVAKGLQPNRKIHPLMKDFSLKKAVVYSEILQRKY